ncbi:phytoene/squalene synthase family protein [Mucisphaera calidilacus]|uniref:All-trans-phytoene synthase n=1 Tax=Mucisphaera calidilacus TaxID=2527982 RepID=A0A518BXT5_9BACT|nr:phytoene/squalene synthase family protein [Mucisphaera calidilacus]QDU71797.1 All-trans-phytoene synthase [Mucisphaera calidilacus]
MTTTPAQPTPQPPPQTLADIQPGVRRALNHCADITKSRAKNFYYGLRLTPEPRRSAVYAIYATMRACDDLADEHTDEELDARRQRINTFRQRIHDLFANPEDNPDDDPVFRAFRHVVRHYPVEQAHIDAMLDGQIADLTTNTYETFDDLYAYCYNVASVVGLTCIAIWGHDGDVQVKQLAEYRGIAFQLTNILRDLAEDATRGRIYLPAEDFKRFGCDPIDLQHGLTSPEFERMMTWQIERARNYYQMSAPLEAHLTPDTRSTSWAMMRIYRGILERIAAKPERVLTTRVRLGGLEKISIAARAHLWQALH